MQACIFLGFQKSKGLEMGKEIKGGKKRNKAGYTANTSRRRVGRGGNARFHTFQPDHYGRTDGPTDGPMDGRTKPLIELRVRN